MNHSDCKQDNSTSKQ